MCASGACDGERQVANGWFYCRHKGERPFSVMAMHSVRPFLASQPVGRLQQYMLIYIYICIYGGKCVYASHVTVSGKKLCNNSLKKLRGYRDINMYDCALHPSSRTHFNVNNKLKKRLSHILQVNVEFIRKLRSSGVKTCGWMELLRLYCWVCVLAKSNEWNY